MSSVYILSVIVSGVIINAIDCIEIQYVLVLNTVVPLMRDHKKSSQKMVSQKGFALFGG